MAELKQSGATLHFADIDELVTKNGTRFELEPSNNMFIWRMVTKPDLECNEDNMSDEHCFATSLQRWHESLGHTNFLDVKRLRHHIDGMHVESKAESEACERCETKKAKCRSVPKNFTTMYTGVMQIVHTDVLEPIAEESIDGHKYAIGFADSFSHFISVYFMKSREECLGKFQDFCADIGKPMLMVLDGAEEFVSSNFKSFCRMEGTRRETSAHRTPQWKMERLKERGEPS